MKKQMARALPATSCIATYADTGYEKRSEHSCLWHLAEAARLCLEKAGLAPQDIDGLAVASFQLPPDNTITLANRLGFRLSWASQGVFGGASTVIQVAHAFGVVARGEAENVLCISGDSLDVGRHMDLIDNFNRPVRDYLAPYPFGAANGMFALVQQRHMHEFGTHPEQLGQIAVTQRLHATLNDNALLREPMTLEDYMHARPIALPLRLYDCVMPCAGAHAVLVTSTERCSSLGLKPVLGLAFGEMHNHSPEKSVPVTGAWNELAEDLWKAAGLDPWDMDFVQLYDDYPIMVLMQLEDLGFCTKGQGGRFLETTDLTVAGDLPLNTGGGQLSAGQAGAGGGQLGLNEAVRQLLGDGGSRQVVGARTGLVSGFGMVGYGFGLSAAALVLKKGWE